MIKRALLLIGLLVLAACATSSVTQLNDDTVQITVHLDPFCYGITGQQLAFKRAAAETVKRGFDKFKVLETSSASFQTLTGTDQVITVKMFKANDPDATDAIAAGIGFTGYSAAEKQGC